MYAKIDGSSVVKCPYTVEDLRKENPNVSFPAELNDDLKRQFSVADVYENERPDFDLSLIHI